MWVAQHFSYKRNGVFIDIGANEGAMGRYTFVCFIFVSGETPSHCVTLSYSNSLLLEKCLNWRGICVEPGVREFAMLSKRGLRSCAVFNVAASNTDGYADFCKTVQRALFLSLNPHF